MTMLTRQIALVEYLTDPAKFEAPSGAVAGVPAGLDPDRLRLVGRLSLGKRMEKIRGVLPRTMSRLRDSAATARDFARAHPPASLSRYENAAQFVAYLERHAAVQPSYLAELAAFELAGAHVKRRSPGGDAAPPPGPGVWIRRPENVAALCLQFDIRPLYRDGDREPLPGPCGIALVQAAGAPGPRVFDVAPALAAYLGSIDDWCELAEARARVRELTDETLAALERAGIVEVRHEAVPGR